MAGAPPQQLQPLTYKSTIDRIPEEDACTPEEAKERLIQYNMMPFGVSLEL